MTTYRPSLPSSRNGSDLSRQPLADEKGRKSLPPPSGPEPQPDAYALWRQERKVSKSSRPKAKRQPTLTQARGSAETRPTAEPRPIRPPGRPRSPDADLTDAERRKRERWRAYSAARYEAVRSAPGQQPSQTNPSPRATPAHNLKDHHD